MTFKLVEGERKDFAMNWADELAANGADSILTSTWTSGTGLTIDDDSFSGGTAVIWVTDGLPASSPVECVNTITTADGRVLKGSLFIYVVERREA